MEKIYAGILVPKKTVINDEEGGAQSREVVGRSDLHSKIDR